MDDKKLQKLKDMMKLLNESSVDRSEMEEFKKFFVSSFKEIKQTFDKKTSGMESDLSRKFGNFIQKTEQEMSRMIETSENKMSKEMKQMMDKCMSDMEEMMSKKTTDLKNEIIDVIPSLGNVEVEISKADTEIGSLKTDIRSIQEELKNMMAKIDEGLKQVRIENASGRGGGVRRVYQPYVDDFSALTDGATKTFYLSREPLKANAILVWGTDFPILLRPNTDFTVSGKILTLTSAVPAPSSGSSLLAQFYA